MNINESDIIHVHIFDPSERNFFYKPKANEKSELHIYSCKDKDGCDAYKKGQCINVGNVFGEKCAVGSKKIIQGSTRRAKKFYDQIRGWKECYSDVYKKLNPAPKKITKVSGGYMLPYVFMSMNESVPFARKSSAFVSGKPFLADEDMTKENILNICSFRPQAIFGGEISKYQKESVPKFIYDLKQCYPKLYSMAFDGSEVAESKLKNINFVGRKAFLKTLKPNIKIKEFTWDGEKLKVENKKFMSFEPIKWESCYCEFKPNDDSVVKVESNEWVTDETVFAD